MSAADAGFMARALQLARNGFYTADPNPRVGCVLVKDGQILAEGWHAQAGQAHAEVDALAKLADPALARGATAYVSLEPCSHHGRTGPCCEALVAAGIRRVVAAMQDPNPLVAGNGLRKMRDAGVEVSCGLLRADAEQLNRGFIKRMLSGLPFVRSKLAMSLDGRTALANGASQWISSEQARQDVQKFRAESSAIVTGIDTVLADDPSLNARVDFAVKQPVRVVLDSHLRMPLNAGMLQLPGETWVIACHEDHAKQMRLRDAGCKVWTVDSRMGRVDLNAAFKLLARQQINTVWVEAGASLNGALLQTELVDEWLLYVAPCILGDSARGLFRFPELHRMEDKVKLELLDSRQIGPDLRLRYRPRRA
ncbi:bifunctional diaminohydroxyphosphoribosylaminopyrimidine deaminase/5-amino-6-(5-phosphoribosylamino)uracil reductase RibD [Methylomonas sp. SURF-2]|uniref:Riboflavin biosynthesis protein RibD n=1 Tax=Methylomonas subterranea TaxID=2952225 RepID=A0ABT1TGN1_9GAMM|nr:bifunctional diaminohydroxyphosphoribosylaminopyrimidine deaminase/5-amino-6-(5-phosphoribosylamino)uracil reductase RibD [Methylomonas sp. SURF-2]MCQ8104618.1 bifunctional diaminohydroxyphosphoribosylaminopyrimidine deaminase/5-amino-6-(5-phosphoribosylamino)uracil reductase RibD [Methylomonas sp. SURF-2]